MAFRVSGFPLLRFVLGVALLLIHSVGTAHVSEQGFVLLLPTKVYTAAGIAVVVGTLIALAFLPADRTHRLFAAFRWTRSNRLTPLRKMTSLISLVVLIGLVLLGWFGPTDPLKNLLPLSVWTLFWIGLVSLHGMVGGVWQWVNPWHGIASWMSKDSVQENPAYPVSATAPVWPALALFIGFYYLMLVDLALTLIGIAVFGRTRWFTEFDFFSVLLRLYGYLAPYSPSPKTPSQSGIGIPGWAILEHPKPSLSLALFALVMLGCGSFDGINETFWWLGIIGVNPLDFQGRSTIVTETVLGMVGTNLLLLVVFTACVGLGYWLAKRTPSPENPTFRSLFCQLALCVLPIALAYHVAHFIASFLVNLQYSAVALNDPLDSGSNWLGLGQYYVTTGFLNNHHTVEILWLAQAGIVVFGHVLSILLSHAVAVNAYQERRAAVVSQIPLAVFMVSYTFLGLWLLASPRGA